MKELTEKKTKQPGKYVRPIYIFGISAAAVLTAFIILLSFYFAGGGTSTALFVVLVVSLAALAVLMAFWIHFLNDRKGFLAEQAFTNRYFKNKRIVYTEASFSRRLAVKMKRKKFKGAIGAIWVSGINSTILTSYGADTVKEVNEIIFSAIYELYHGDRSVMYAFDVLDGFLLYKDTDSLSNFESDLRALSSLIDRKAKESGSLPALKTLIGEYLAEYGDSPEDAIKRACFAQQFSSETRLENEIVSYTPDMLKQNEAEKNLSQEFGKALLDKQLEVYYQPQYDIKKKKFTGAEALVRWNHPVRGVLPPSLFIPFAERTGRVIEVDRYVFRQVCSDIKKWEKEKRRLIRISINMSRKSTYDPNMLDYYKKTIAELKVNPLLIEVEITESATARDPIFVYSLIKDLKEIGFGVAMDDFGVGYSSLGTLKQMPFDTLKIDKVFIDDIEVDKKARIMTESIISIGHALDMQVIAEGVQTEKQADILAAMNLDTIQGFYYSHVLPRYEFEKFIGGSDLSAKKGERS